MLNTRSRIHAQFQHYASCIRSSLQAGDTQGAMDLLQAVLKMHEAIVSSEADQLIANLRDYRERCHQVIAEHKAAQARTGPYGFTPSSLARDPRTQPPSVRTKASTDTPGTSPGISAQH